MERRKITLPLTRELARTRHAGDQVLLTGTIYTSRGARPLQKEKRFLLTLQTLLFTM